MISLVEFAESSRKDGTVRQYKLDLCRFIEAVYKLPSDRKRKPDYILQMDQYSIQYLSEERDYFRDLLFFAGQLKDFSPNTQSNAISTAKIWLEMNDIVIPRSKMTMIKRRLDKRRPITKDHALSFDDVKLWYEHLSRLGKVALLLQMSSGMRIGELIQIRIDDINWDSQPVEINIRAEVSKTQKERYVFISSEASYALTEWLKVRQGYLDSAMKRSCMYPKKKNDSRIIPLTHSTIQQVYIRGLKKSGLYSVYDETNRTTITSHSLRKFWFSQMKTVMPSTIVELLGGHEMPYHGAYVRYPKEQVKQEYLKAEYTVSIHAPINMGEFQAKERDMQDQMNYVISELTRAQQERESLKAALSVINERFP